VFKIACVGVAFYSSLFIKPIECPLKFSQITAAKKTNLFVYG